MCFCFLFLLWGCTGSQEEKVDLVAVGDVITEFRAAVNSARTDEILARYAEDAIILPANEEVVVGKQAVNEFWNRRAYTGIDLVEETSASWSWQVRSKKDVEFRLLYLHKLAIILGVQKRKGFCR